MSGNWPRYLMNGVKLLLLVHLAFRSNFYFLNIISMKASCSTFWSAEIKRHSHESKIFSLSTCFFKIVTSPKFWHWVLCYLSWQPWHFPAHSTMSSIFVNSNKISWVEAQLWIVLNKTSLNLFVVPILLLMSFIYLVSNHIAHLMVVNSESDLNSKENYSIASTDAAAILPCFDLPFKTRNP